MAARTNLEQADAWNGDEGIHWVEHQARYDAMMHRLTPRLLEANRDRLIQVLAAAGWEDIDVQAVEEPMLMGRDADDVVQFMRGSRLARELLQSVDDETTHRALASMRDALVPFQRDDGVWLRSASWLVDATR